MHRRDHLRSTVARSDEVDADSKDARLSKTTVLRESLRLFFASGLGSLVFLLILLTLLFLLMPNVMP